MLEHEAFKGSRRIGTTSWKKEKPLLEAQDEGRRYSHSTLTLARTDSVNGRYLL